MAPKLFVLCALICSSFADPGLYGIKLHTVLGRWDSSLNTVDPTTGIVNNIGEVQLFSKTYYPIQNGLAAQELGNNSRLFQLFSTDAGYDYSDPMATIAFPNITVSLSSGAPQGVQYLCYDGTLSNNTLFGVASSYQENITVVEVNPTTGVTTHIVTLNMAAPFMGMPVVAALDSLKHVLYIVGYLNQAERGFQEIVAVSLPSGKVLGRGILKTVTLYALVCDSSTGQLFGVAGTPNSNAAWVVQVSVNGTAQFLGKPLPGSFGFRTVGAIDADASVAYFVGQVGVSDSIFTVDITTGDLNKIMTLNYADGGNLVSMVFANL